MPVDIVPIEESHIDGFHRTLDCVARERGYLVFLGLDTEGVQRHAVHVDGVYEDLILMAVLF